MELPSYHRSYTQRWGGRPSRRKPGSTSLRRPAQAGRIHTGRQASHQAAADANRGSLEKVARQKWMTGVWERRAFQDGAKANVVGEELGHATDELSGVTGGGMMAESGQRKLGTSRGQPRHTRTAKAPRISRSAMKSQCACERDAWGRLSVDGPGHYNPDRSEGPWGRATNRSLEQRRSTREALRRRQVGTRFSLGEREGRIQTVRSEGHAGCWLNPSTLTRVDPPLARGSGPGVWGDPLGHELLGEVRVT